MSNANDLEAFGDEIARLATLGHERVRVLARLERLVDGQILVESTQTMKRVVWTVQIAEQILAEASTLLHVFVKAARLGRIAIAAAAAATATTVTTTSVADTNKAASATSTSISTTSTAKRFVHRGARVELHQELMMMIRIASCAEHVAVMVVIVVVVVVVVDCVGVTRSDGRTVYILHVGRDTFALVLIVRLVLRLELEREQRAQARIASRVRTTTAAAVAVTGRRHTRFRSLTCRCRCRC